MSIEKCLTDLTVAINNLTAAAKEIMEKLDGGAPAACPAPPVEEKPKAKKAAPKKAPKEQPPKAAPAETLDACVPPPPSLDELKAVLGAAVTDCGRPAVLALLKQYSSNGKASDVAEADRAACIIAAKAMAVGEKKDADDDF